MTKRPADKAQRALDAYFSIKGEGGVPTRAEIQKRSGAGRTTVQSVLASIEVAAGVSSMLSTEDLPIQSRRRLEAAIASHKRKLDNEFEFRVREEATKRVNELSLPAYFKKLDKLIEMLNSPRNAVMTKDEYRTIVACLHPDKLNSLTPERMGKAFRIFTQYKPKMVLDKEDNKKTLSTLPKTLAEMIAKKK